MLRCPVPWLRQVLQWCSGALLGRGEPSALPMCVIASGLYLFVRCGTCVRRMPLPHNSAIKIRATSLKSMLCC